MRKTFDPNGKKRSIMGNFFYTKILAFFTLKFLHFLTPIFFTSKILLFLHQFLKVRKKFVGKNWCRKAKNGVPKLV